jgi:hypothetical protein
LRVDTRVRSRAVGDAPVEEEDVGTFIVGVAVLVLLLLSLRVRRLRVRRLWVTPAVVSLFCLLAVLRDWPRGMSLTLLALALPFGVGAAVGVLRGRLATVWADRAHAVIAIKQSVTGVVLWAMVLLAKVILRIAASGTSADRALTVMVAMFTTGTMLAYTWWIYRRYQRGKVEAMAAQSAVVLQRERSPARWTGW